ncbi:phosphate-selective porin O and P [Halothiobacillus diazotrophicus]|uniref:Phosphate-selective porin O and P n=1 Tax=Halothiobacillus diazotrophicus TaxID=1860122 RepID=A0A191ZHD6_9GAMM|nr:porin [Halothiobacillus diazotrophicus]ANJ67263.1 phosphate-selective porin O and P [Halothiobacillus diazotrophicus]
MHTHFQNKKFQKFLALSALCAGMAAAMPSAHAANWIMLQGTEPAGTAPRADVWGFIQPTYSKDFSSPYAGKYNPSKLIGPSLDSQSSFGIQRARIGVRGTGFPLDSKINYFLLTEFGDNVLTDGGAYGSYKPVLTDASVTLNYIKGARIRLGLFKYPGAEEGLQGINLFPYINYTDVTNQMLLERFPTKGEVNIAPQPTPNANMNAFSQPGGAFRDVGVQVFDAFDMGNWEHTYAIMLGNGHGVQMSDNNSSKDLYLYWSSAYLFDKNAKGAFQPSVKMFTWYQNGKRTDVWNTSQEQDRKRYGAGVTYMKMPFRATAEYMWGRGMIFQGAQNPGNGTTTAATIFNDNKAAGGYIEGGWYIPNSKWELDLRYDTYKRNIGVMSGPMPEAKFSTWTTGVNYHFNKKTRFTLNYAFRKDSAVTTAVNNQLKDVKGLLSLQVTAAF